MRRTILEVDAHGQVTLPKPILKHLGVEVGGRIEFDLVPGGQAVLKANRPKGDIYAFTGMFAGRSEKVATLEEIDEAAQQGWAGDR